jgi:hypothetical protein
VGVSLATATDLAAQLDLALAETPVCLACLSFVSAGLREGDEKDTRRWAKEMTPFIWEEGLAAPALEAVRHAAEQGVADADACLADLDARAGRSVVARTIVFRLAVELAEEERRSAELHQRARKLLGSAPVEWN